MYNHIKIAITVLLCALCLSVDVTAPMYEEPLTSINPSITVTSEPTETTEPIETTEPTEPESTEPVYEFIDISPLPELPEIDALETIYDVEDAINICTAAISEYDEILDSMALEHPQYNDIYLLRSELEEAANNYQNMLDEHWRSREEKRPVMTYVWKALKEYGYSDAVVAGILGNLSAETGGMGYQDIQWDIKVRGYYGICMWALKYAPDIDGASLDEQIEYLVSTIEYEMNIVYGVNIRKRFGIYDLRYDDFLEIDNPYDAAIAFGVCYERPNAGHIQRRGPQAEKAYEYYIYLNSWPWPGR